MHAMEYANLASTGRGIEFRYPLLDLELVRFYLATPNRLKRRAGVGRLLFRLSLKGGLPEEIRTRAGGASANPGEVLRRHRDQDELRARLQALLPENRLFDYANLRKLDGPLEIRTSEGARAWRRTLPLVSLLVLERNPSYHGDVARVDSVVFHLWAGVPMNMYESGEIDITGVSLYHIDRVTDEAGPFHTQLVVAPELSFSEIKQTLGLSDGNLSAHAASLQRAGYIEIAKTFKGRRPHTSLRLTRAGQKAFRSYVETLRRIIEQGE